MEGKSREEHSPNCLNKTGKPPVSLPLICCLQVSLINECKLEEYSLHLAGTKLILRELYYLKAFRLSPLNLLFCPILLSLSSLKLPSISPFPHSFKTFCPLTHQWILSSFWIYRYYKLNTQMLGANVNEN